MDLCWWLGRRDGGSCHEMQAGSHGSAFHCKLRCLRYSDYASCQDLSCSLTRERRRRGRNDAKGSRHRPGHHHSSSPHRFHLTSSIIRIRKTSSSRILCFRGRARGNGYIQEGRMAGVLLSDGISPSNLQFHQRSNRVYSLRYLYQHEATDLRNPVLMAISPREMMP